MIRTRKHIAILTVILITVLLSVLLVCHADIVFAKTFDQKVDDAIKGGTVKTWTMAQWELHKYKDVTLPKKEPFCFAPWRSYLAINSNVEVGTKDNQNALTIDADLYDTIIDEANENKATAKQILKDINAKGHGWSAYRKIHKYMQDSKYFLGIKTAKGFFEHRGGDCAAYSSAFYVLCKVQGIPVRWCMGGFGSTCHAWNKVKLGGKWYWVDETFGYAPQRQMYKDHRKPMEMW